MDKSTVPPSNARGTRSESTNSIPVVVGTCPSNEKIDGTVHFEASLSPRQMLSPRRSCAGINKKHRVRLSTASGTELCRAVSDCFNCATDFLISCVALFWSLRCPGMVARGGWVEGTVAVFPRFDAHPESSNNPKSGSTRERKLLLTAKFNPSALINKELRRVGGHRRPGSH